LPLRLVTDEAVDDEQLQPGITLPRYVRDYHRTKRNAE
jgi:hypothetical protein